MKKLIIILFMFSFLINAQTVRTFQPSEDWSFNSNTVKYSLAGVVIGGASYLSIGNNPAWGEKDIETYKGKCRNAIIITTLASMGKQYVDVMAGYKVSFADMGYTIGSAAITAFIFKHISIHRYKKRQEKFNIQF